jgi:hypothetical protein
MCGGGKAARRAADAAAAEQKRQFEIEQERLRAESEAAKAEAERRFAAEQARYEALLAQQRAEAEAARKQLEDQANRQLTEQQRIEAERKAEREADLARQALERSNAEKAAAEKATALRGYNDNRQSLVDGARQQIESFFMPYNDEYFGKVAGDYVGAMKPQLEQQYDDAKRATTFSFANKGTLDSTAAARAFGRVDQTRAKAAGDIAQNAQAFAGDVRGSIDKQRNDLLSGVFGAINAAPVITADNVGDANSSLASLTSALSAPVSMAQSSASKFTLPSYGNLSQLFETPASSPGARTSYSGGTGASYGSNRGSSGRLVA